MPLSRIKSSSPLDEAGDTKSAVSSQVLPIEEVKKSSQTFPSPPGYQTGHQKKRKRAAYMREYERLHRKERNQQSILCRRRNPGKYASVHLREKHRQVARDSYKRRAASVIEKERQRQQDYPEKKKAHRAVAAAVKSGRLIRGACADCGGAENVQAHHHDYSKPLDVTWLCPPCHAIRHPKKRKYPLAPSPATPAGSTGGVA